MCVVHHNFIPEYLARKRKEGKGENCIKLEIRKRK